MTIPAGRLPSYNGSDNKMPETPLPPPPQPPQPPTEPPTNFHIGEEFGTAKRNLPPAGIVLLCVAAVALILAALAYFQRQKPQGTGAIDVITAVDVPQQNRIMVMVAVTITLRNVGKKPLWIRDLNAQLTTSDGKTFDDRAASAVDFDRYFQAFPPLKLNTKPALYPEAKFLPGTELQGTVIVSFPVSKETFDQRKSLAVIIQPYDQVLPVVLTK